MKPTDIPTELSDQPLSGVFQFMRRHGFSIEAHRPKKIDSAQSNAGEIWNFSDANMAAMIGIAPNTFRKILADDPTVKWTTVEKVASFFLLELEPGSPLRSEWFEFIENRWQALSEPKANPPESSEDQADAPEDGSQDVERPPALENRRSRGVIFFSLAVIAAVASGTWFFENSKSTQQQPSSEAGQSQTDQTPQMAKLAPETITYSAEQRSRDIDKLLDAALVSFNDRSTSADRVVLNTMIQGLHGRQADPQNDFEKYVADLIAMDASLLEAAAYYHPYRIEDARAALRLGDTSKAEEVWKGILSYFSDDLEQFGERAALAALKLGELQIADFRWLEGAGNYRLAAEISPTAAYMAKAGAFLWKIGDFHGAAHFERQVLQIVRAENEPNSDEIAGALSSLGLTLAALGKFEEAETLYIEALDIRRANLPADDPALMRTVNNYCNTLIAMNRLADASVYCNEALEVRQAQKESNPYGYAISLIVTSGLERKRNNHLVAEGYLREAADIAKNDQAYWGPRSARYAQTIYQLGLLMYELNELSEAEDLIEDSIDIVDELSGDMSPDLFIRKSALAKVRASLGAEHEALTLATHAYANLNFLFDDPNHPDVLDAKSNLEQIRSNMKFPP